MQGHYSMFITMLPHLDPMMFYLATQQNAQTNAVAGAEKTAFAWCDCLCMLHPDNVTSHERTPLTARHFLTLGCIEGW